jgi:hypothetical protein
VKKYLLILIIAAAVLLAAQKSEKAPARDDTRDPSAYAHTGGRTGSGIYTKFGTGSFLPGSGGSVNAGTAQQIAYYATTGTAVSGDANFIDTGSEIDAYGSKVCTTANLACGAGGGGTGFPAQTGMLHQLSFSPTTTVGTSDGNTFPSGLWSHLQGTWTVHANIASSNVPPNMALATNTGTAGASASESEDSVAQQWNFSIWNGFSCYCAVETGTGQIVWFGFSSVLYGSLVNLNPNATIWGFRYAAGTDTNWKAYVSTSNVNFTATDTGVAVSGSVFHRFNMARNSLGGIDYYIDDAKVATIASGATGFPGTTNTFMVLEDGLLSNAADRSLFVNSIRGWYRP